MPNQAIIRQTTSRQSDTTNPYTGGPSVLCAGLWRTGTSSLQLALEAHLGLAPCLHGAHLVTNIDALKLFHRCCFEEDSAKRRKWLANWFDHFPASTDLPGFAFVDDLIEMYPSMRVVLNERSSAEAWLKSVEDSLEFYASTTYFIIGYWDPYLYWHHQIYTGMAHLFRRRFGISRQNLFSTRTYEMHNDWVRDLARNCDRPFLEYEVKEGWGPLCQFLEIQVPKDKDSGVVIEFPRTNDAAEMKELKRYLIWKGLKAWAFVLAPVTVTAIGMYVALLARD
ncbi:hypothetical protein PMZ80_007737 [Knufia obscura]|uniref:Sulfotransferase n=1 Tax=Knufia obscura TaxID=1635080 RepID=A0ABR0RI71_9EURO|nr:hypothetical protein PMZ80_007737 [Knufia obscura]